MFEATTMFSLRVGPQGEMEEFMEGGDVNLTWLNKQIAHHLKALSKEVVAAGGGLLTVSVSGFSHDVLTETREQQQATEPPADTLAAREWAESNG